MSYHWTIAGLITSRPGPFCSQASQATRTFHLSPRPSLAGGKTVARLLLVKVVRSPDEEVANRQQKKPFNAAFFHFFSPSNLSIRPSLGTGAEEILEGGEGRGERERERRGKPFFAVSPFRFSLPTFPPETPNVQVTSHLNDALKTD